MMFLLDTHALLWFLTDDPKMPKNVKALSKRRRIFA